MECTALHTSPLGLPPGGPHQFLDGGVLNPSGSNLSRTADILGRLSWRDARLVCASLSVARFAMALRLFLVCGHAGG